MYVKGFNHGYGPRNGPSHGGGGGGYKVEVCETSIFLQTTTAICLVCPFQSKPMTPPTHDVLAALHEVFLFFFRNSLRVGELKTVPKSPWPSITLRTFFFFFRKPLRFLIPYFKLLVWWVGQMWRAMEKKKQERMIKKSRTCFSFYLASCFCPVLQKKKFSQLCGMWYIW